MKKEWSTTQACTVILIFLSFTDDEHYMPFWRKVNLNNPITTRNSPHILRIKKFSINDAGDYYCKTTNENEDEVEVGFRLSVDNRGKVKLMGLQQNQINENEIKPRSNETDKRMPNINLYFSDKTALTKGEQVEVFCETGNFIPKFKVLLRILFKN